MSLHGGKAFISVAAVAVAILLGATACTAGAPPAPASVSPSETPPPSPTTSVPQAVSCDQLLPLEAAAEAAGVPGSTLSAGPRETDAAGSTIAVSVAMAAAAHSYAGEISCSRLEPTAGDARGAGVQLKVLPGGAAYFAQIEPDGNDGLGGLEPVAIGDAAYLVCNDGEANSCRIEATSGDAWFSLRVGPRPTDTAATTALAESVAAIVRELPPSPPAADIATCEELTDVDALAGVGLPDPVTDDYLDLSRGGSAYLAAERHGSTAFCSWTSNGGGGSISLRAVPLEESPAPTDPTGGAQSSLPLEPISGLGEAAVGGCADGFCEIDVVGGGVWMNVSALDGADVDALRTLAAGLLSRLEA